MDRNMDGLDAHFESEEAEQRKNEGRYGGYRRN